MSRDLRCPFAETYSEVLRKSHISFHALPIGNSHALDGSPFEDLYKKVLGSRLGVESCIGPPIVDNVSLPEGALLEAEEMAAITFGADRTLFTSCGTSISNEIVIRAVVDGSNRRVLVDRGVHQSIHFALENTQAKVEYLPEVEISERHHLYAVDVNALEKVLRTAEMVGRPFDILIMNGQTYEGLIYNIGHVLKVARHAGPSLKIAFIDEAWGTTNYFHPATHHFTAMAAAREQGGNFSVIATQSAHKSTNALRQGSYIHFKGNTPFLDRLLWSRYRLHTTSPSLSILASLDLARAQMAAEGRQRIDRSLTLVRHLQDAIATDPDLARFELCNLSLSNDQRQYIAFDASKVLITSVQDGQCGPELKQALFDQFGIYSSRSGPSYLLFNFHIGTCLMDAEFLITALKTLEMREVATNENFPDLDLDQEGEISSSFFIPYPPGVPIVIPGEAINKEKLRQMLTAKQFGSRMTKVGQSSSPDVSGNYKLDNI